MAYGFSGNIQSFVRLVEKGSVGKALSDNRQRTGGNALSKEEQQVWDDDTIVLADFLRRMDVPKHSTYLMLHEYDIPGHLGRCDVVMLGADSTHTKHASVFELKSWQSFAAGPTSAYVNVAGSLHLHPSEQALQYRDCLQMFHQRGREYTWHAGAWMTSMAAGPVIDLQRLAPAEAPVWGLRNPDENLNRSLSSWFGGGLPEVDLRSFRDGSCVPDARLAEALLARLPGLTRGVFAALGGRPIDLSQRQEGVVTAILREVRSGERVLILVSGAPGCGKTVVGLHALVHQLVRNVDAQHRTIRQRSVLALRNNRLCTVVRSAIDDSLRMRVGRGLVQYVKGAGPGVGIFYQVQNSLKANINAAPLYDLVVVDEAHRVPNDNGGDTTRLSQVEAVLRAGRAVVCLYDEGQLLNEDDNGDQRTFGETWRRLFPGSPIIELSLDEQHRLPQAYTDWLQSFLSGTRSTLPAGYDFLIANHPEEVIGYLRTKTDDDDCGLLASYTTCNGRNGNNLRLPALGVRWLMEKEEYNIWWRDRSVRHRFDKCSSVYGCQGFELDYAGVFWGRDLAISLDKDRVVFDLSEPHDVQDDIGLAYGRKLRTMADEAVSSANTALKREVVRRLVNRYRILLSRARKGLIVYCEDAGTRETLRHCTG